MTNKATTRASHGGRPPPCPIRHSSFVIPLAAGGERSAREVPAGRAVWLGPRDADNRVEGEAEDVPRRRAGAGRAVGGGQGVARDLGGPAAVAVDRGDPLQRARVAHPLGGP